MKDFSLKMLLDNDFDLDLPISGGLGGSKEDAIIIHRAVPNDYVSVEQMILKCLGIGRRIRWKFIKQSLLVFNGRSIDQIKIETEEVTDTEIITTTENYYFDVSECLSE